MIADVTGVGAFGELIGSSVVNDPGTGHTFVKVPTIGHTYTFSSNLLLDQNRGFSRMSQNVIGSDYGTIWGLERFGIPGTNGPDPRQSGCRRQLRYVLPLRASRPGCRCSGRIRATRTTAISHGPRELMNSGSVRPQFRFGLRLGF
jgi:hypothetical protein